MERTIDSTSLENVAGDQEESELASLDEKLAVALGDLSVRACAFDKMCRAQRVPAFVGDYLLKRYGDDDAGLSRASRVLFSARFVDKGMPPVGTETICRVFGMRRTGEDVYGITTPSPLLHALGIAGDEIRAKGLLDGSWCHLSICRTPVEGFMHFHIFDGMAPEDLITPGSIVNHSIDGIQPVRGRAEAVERLLELRSRLTLEEWMLLLLRSYGLGGEKLSFGEQLRILVRLAPLAEPGLRVLYTCDGKHAEAQEVSPYEISSDQLKPDHEGFPGSWDCVVTAGEPGRGAYGLSMLLDGYEGTASGVSLVAISDGDEAQAGRLKRLFGPFHLAVRAPHDSGSQDQWSGHLGVNRCLLAELWHALRRRDTTHEVDDLLSGAGSVSAQSREAARLVVSSISKVLYPTGKVPVSVLNELLDLV